MGTPRLSTTTTAASSALLEHTEAEGAGESDCHVGITRIVDIEIVGFHDSSLLGGDSKQAIVEKLAIVGIKKEKVTVRRAGRAHLGQIRRRWRGQSCPMKPRPAVFPGANADSACPFLPGEGVSLEVTVFHNRFPASAKLNHKHVPIVVRLRGGSHVYKRLRPVISCCDVFRLQSIGRLRNIPYLLEAGA